MIRKSRAVVLLGLYSGTSYADAAFYTYGGFETVVDGFKRIALTVANDTYLAYVAAFLVFGVVAAMLKHIYRGASAIAEGKGTVALPSALSLIVPPLIGVVIVKGLLLPTTTMHIYDSRKNQYEAVGGVPTLIAHIAGTMNNVERGYIEDIVDTSSAHTYTLEGGGVSFKLIQDAMYSVKSLSNSYDVMNLKRYFTDCGTFALSVDSSTVNINKLRSETDDLASVFGEMVSSSIFTVMQSPTNKTGSTLSCTEAYNDHIQPIFANTAGMTAIADKACAKSGYDVSIASVQQACYDRLTSAIDLVFNTDSTIAVDAFIKNAVIANAMSEQLKDEDPDSMLRSMTNQSMMVSGLSTAIGSQDWYADIKAMLTVTIAGLLPILALLLATPLVTKALPLMFSLMAFVTLWGIIDATMHQGIMDAMIRVLSSVHEHKMGLAAFWLTPDAVSKALTVMADSRSQALGIAAALSSMLFGVSAFAMSSMGTASVNEVEHSGDAAGQKTLDPVHSADYVDSLVNAQAAGIVHTNNSMDDQVSAETFNKQQQITHGNLMGDQLGGALQAATKSGQASAGRSAGDIKALAQDGNILKTSQQTAETQTSQSIGQATGANNAADALGTTVRDMAQTGSEVSAKRQHGENLLDQQMMNMIKGSTGNDAFDNSFAAKQLAALDNSKLTDLRATNGNPDRAIRADTNQRVQQIERSEGLEKGLKRTGQTLESASYASGIKEGHEMGTEAGFVQKNPEKALATTQAEIFDEHARNYAIAETAKDNGGLEQYTYNRSMTEEADRAAQSEVVDALSRTLGLDSQEVQQLRHGANIGLAMPQWLINQAADSHVITDEQAQILREEGGGYSQLSAFINKQGLIESTTGSTQAGYSTNTDNSQITTDKVVHDTRNETRSGSERVDNKTVDTKDRSTHGFHYENDNSLSLGARYEGPDTARLTVTDGEMLGKALHQAEDKAYTAAKLGATALEGVYSQDFTLNSVSSFGVGASVSKPGTSAIGGNVDLSSGANTIDSEHSDTLFGSLHQAYTSLEREAESSGLTGVAKESWVNEQYADLNQHIHQTAVERAVDESGDLSLANGIQNHFEDRGFSVAADSMDAPNLFELKPFNPMNDLSN